MNNKEKEMNIPDDLKYSEDHQWIKMIDDITGICGITDFAQNDLGEIVLVEFINNIVNRETEKGEKIAIIESLKDSIDIFSILPGKILEINRYLEDSPELINSSTYEDGWIYKIELEDALLLEDLLEPDEYIENIMPDDF
jgi:glycine cleavage system H protein